MFLDITLKLKLHFFVESLTGCNYFPALNPLSTGRTTPLMKDDSSSNKNVTTRPISWGLPKEPLI